MTAAYSATGTAWQDGPGRIYDRLATLLVERVPAGAAGPALDLGAGTGAASRALLARGLDVVALDVAFGMLAVEGATRAPAVVADALALPFRSGSFGAVVAAFSLNHLTAPAAALSEARRVTEEGGTIVASAYAVDNDHPAKQATDQAAAELGWAAPGWYSALQAEAMPLLATPDRAMAVADTAGLVAAAEVVRVSFPELGATELVAWRLGMAQLAPFVAGLSPAERGGLTTRAVQLLGAAPTLVLSVVMLSATVP